jgi:hypothetical protein
LVHCTTRRDPQRAWHRLRVVGGDSRGTRSWTDAACRREKGARVSASGAACRPPCPVGWRCRSRFYGRQTEVLVLRMTCTRLAAEESIESPGGHPAERCWRKRSRFQKYRVQQWWQPIGRGDTVLTLCENAPSRSPARPREASEASWRAGKAGWNPKPLAPQVQLINSNRSPRWRETRVLTSGLLQFFGLGQEVRSHFTPPSKAKAAFRFSPASRVLLKTAVLNSAGIGNCSLARCRLEACATFHDRKRGRP